MTLLDVLSGLDHVNICTGYKHRGQRLDYFRADMDTLAEVEPIYETLPGWRGNISGCRRFEELPKEAQQYVKRVETAHRRADQDGQRRPGADGDDHAVRFVRTIVPPAVVMADHPESNPLQKLITARVRRPALRVFVACLESPMAASQCPRWPAVCKALFRLIHWKEHVMRQFLMLAALGAMALAGCEAGFW